MSWIKDVDRPELPAVFRALSLNTQALEAVEQLNEALAFGSSTLSRVQEEAIATVVSVANRCRYGALTHSAFLRRYSGDSDLASQILADYTQSDISPRERHMLDIAVRVTLEPNSLSACDIEGLRAEDFDDLDIVSIVMLTCLFNFMNRVASSLGVEVPPGFQRGVESWLTGPATQETWLLNHQAPVPQPEEATLPDDLLEEPLSGPDQDADLNDIAAEPEKEPSILSRFVEDCCSVSPEEASSARDLYVAYLRWCDETDHSPLLQRNFGLGLSELGFHRRRRGHGRHWWYGIAIKNTDSDDLDLS